ncbi:hypothetical protein GTQ34_05335 [Muricauda sp. JGD-17]|uniref:DUF998 domain-containing protein n=1 Tax=Flagellimonas ochracea TaxID=2696472 RepID=A0A964TD77_9FLAO|nr:hypothetical protein [Allomuricauda ochracea]NAY91336.1 hypothetical protein [Allomuricauda ochracea]
MKSNFWHNRNIVLLFPVFGMILFVLLYILAALAYPGGSYTNPNHDAFSFWNNYLCDLLDTYTVSGVLNSGRIFARLALLVLCLSLILLWYHLPKLFSSKNKYHRIMQISGIISLGITLLLSDGNHDLIVRIAGVFGVIALLATFVELFKAKFYFLFSLGIFCLIIFFINYYIYETGVYIGILPIIQKVTFAGFICWFLLLNILLYRKQNTVFEL